MEVKSLHEPCFIEFCAKHLWCILSHFYHTTLCQLLRINDIIVFLWNFESFFIFLRRWKLQSHFFILIFSINLRLFFFFEKNKLENFVVEPWTKITNNLDGKMQFCSYCFGTMQKSRANTSTLFLLIIFF